MKAVVDAWYRKRAWLYALIPASAIYMGVVALRRLCYRLGLFRTVHFPIPVIVVGNITVGGTGKTPLVIKLANVLLSQGYKPGIVSRGYGGQKQKLPLEVFANSDPLLVGDEPLLIARRTCCPMVVSPNRVAAVQLLLKNNTCDVVISDDGLQHYALGRDLEIAVIDGNRRLGNGLCLPAGPLRESPKRLKTVDFQVTQGQAQPGEWWMHLITEELTPLRQPPRKFPIRNGQPIHAVAGIGYPERFFAELRHLGFNIETHAFPDHYRFQASDIDFGAESLVIMTEKDAVKCEAFADHRHWYLPVHAQCNSQFLELFLEKLNRAVFNKACLPQG